MNMPRFAPLSSHHLLSPLRAAARAVSAALAVSLAVSGLPSLLHAQVGHMPSSSPYQDLKPTQDLSLSVGRFGTGKELAGVGLKPGTAATLRYDLSIGGPAFMTASYSLLRNERNVLNPAKNENERLIGTVNATTHLVDLGLNLALTGKKTWHHLVPSIGGGVGLASNFAKADTGGYKFGTKFAFNWGGTVKYVLNNGMSLRANATNYIWPYTYPDSYLTNAPDNTSVLKTSQRSKYAGHWALVFGASYPIFR